MCNTHLSAQPAQMYDTHLNIKTSTQYVPHICLHSLHNIYNTIYHCRKEETTKDLLVECDKYSLANDGGNPDLEFICGDGKVPAHQVDQCISVWQTLKSVIFSSCLLGTASFSGLSSTDFKMLSSALEIGPQDKCFFLTGTKGILFVPIKILLMFAYLSKYKLINHKSYISIICVNSLYFY